MRTVDLLVSPVKNENTSAYACTTERLLVIILISGWVKKC